MKPKGGLLGNEILIQASARGNVTVRTVFIPMIDIYRTKVGGGPHDGVENITSSMVVSEKYHKDWTHHVSVCDGFTCMGSTEEEPDGPCDT